MSFQWPNKPYTIHFFLNKPHAYFMHKTQQHAKIIICTIHGQPLTILWPLIPANPYCTLRPNNEMDTWPHLIFTCTNQYTKGLWIIYYNKAIHQVVHTFNPTSILDSMYSIMQVTTTHVHRITWYLSGCCNVHAPPLHAHAWLALDHTYHAY